MSIIGVIPVRLASTRFPGKPMATIHGMPMIGHIWHRSRMCGLIGDVYVATCDREIEEYVESIGGKVVMTKDTHERATDRTVEAVLKIEKQTGSTPDIVVMIQGDEPMVTPRMLEEAVRPMMDDPSISVVNLMAALNDEAEHADANEIKVVVDLRGDALFFSREPIPSGRKWKGILPMLKQVCIIPFRRDYLLTYSRLPKTPLEAIESIDMLRILEHGGKVRMVMTNQRTYSVDTREDLLQVEELMTDDPLRIEYQRA